MDRIKVVSISGGKDSTACALLALEQYPNDDIRFVTADTGNESEITLEYINEYLPRILGVEITTVKADFTAQLRHKADVINEKWLKDGVSKVRRETALASLVPSGNPFLDLCKWKGRFPSRMAQFCTQELKIIPIAEYNAQLMAKGFTIESWQGVRRDESKSRASAKCWEVVSNDYWVRRPIVAWTAQQTVDYVLSKGVELNPLYSQGCSRVGCFPCINSRKEEIRNIAKRYPSHIDRIEAWEGEVACSSKRGGATFFASPGYFESPEDVMLEGNIRKKVEWSKTARGGKQYDLLNEISDACSSAYGLCE